MVAHDKKRLGILLVTPALIFTVVCFLLPVLALLLDAFRVDGPVAHWGLDRFIAFFAEPLNRQVFMRTLRIAALVTLFSALLSYPAAQAIVRVSPRYRGLVLGMMILPLMVSPIARTYAWIVLFGRNGAINSTLLHLGLADEPQRLLFSEMAVFVGLLQLLLPLMLMSLVSSMENLSRDITLAASTLGANAWQVFTRVTLPLTQEGLIVGGTLVFTGCVTAYVTPALLGGPKVLMLETLLYQKVSVESDFGTANVIAVILVAMTLAVNAGLKRISSSRSTA
ncbi:ABC-type spermidine/putrescine transport system, permease component I [Herbaspirillum sp. CF444]|uniref:ABC transporter permease n=1 Tax=Herbaspirillum sp. CF444 TaxID=1144319 RepID=UPI0002725772|nr:ABC transporter permease [Herbaspirillum sp. CF444]EJL92728.1 ABC-type spermidine/putrescine transport system, permease component I [Herbaspirillum sp. CF444]